MAKVIEIYVPESFKKSDKWVPPEQRGKVIPFPGGWPTLCTTPESDAPPFAVFEGWAPLPSA
jgi:hypothetical protein